MPPSRHKLLLMAAPSCGAQAGNPLVTPRQRHGSRLLSLPVPSVHSCSCRPADHLNSICLGLTQSRDAMHVHLQAGDLHATADILPHCAAPSQARRSCSWRAHSGWGEHCCLCHSSASHTAILTPDAINTSHSAADAGTKLKMGENCAVACR